MMALGVLNARVPRLWLYLRYWWNKLNFSSATITFDRLYAIRMYIPTTFTNITVRSITPCGLTPLTLGWWFHNYPASWDHSCIVNSVLSFIRNYSAINERDESVDLWLEWSVSEEYTKNAYPLKNYIIPNEATVTTPGTTRLQAKWIPRPQQLPTWELCFFLNGYGFLFLSHDP